MKTTQTPQFLEYLHEHKGTKGLANELAGVLALRGRLDLISTRNQVAGQRRIAS